MLIIINQENILHAMFYLNLYLYISMKTNKYGSIIVTYGIWFETTILSAEILARFPFNYNI